jgi:hypothetical protein
MLARSLLIGIALLALAAGAAAAPPDEAIIPLERYTTEKGRALGQAFADRLRRIYDRVYHCRPWLDVQTRGLGFNRPAGRLGDDRYLNIWVRVEQTINPEFAALSTEQRHSAMFSRHGVDLLRQISADASIFADPALTGYSVILTWIKPDGRAGAEEKAETLGLFADKATVRAFLAREISPGEFVKRAAIVAFDGKDRLGGLPLEIGEDDFAATFKPKDYQPDDPNVRC